MGATSLGACCLELDNEGRLKGRITALARIFSDGRDAKTGASLAIDRRAARAMRRRRDRFKRRQAALIKYLTQDGLFPADPIERKTLEALDPFELRARALDQKLPLHHLGRAFFHLNQRRGFKSNRKADRGQDDDAGKIAIGIDRLRQQIEESGSRTFGEFLHKRRLSAADDNAIPPVRTRLRPETGEGAKGDGYDFYPGRALVEEEFEDIWEAQAKHHPSVLTDAVRDRLYEIIFHQRPLKKPKIGRCTLLPAEERLPKAHPLFQRRRLLEEINALRIVLPGEVPVALTLEQRNALVLALKDSRKKSFESLRKTLKLDPDARFNKESENRTELKGDEVAAELGAKARFHKRWQHFSADEQWTIISRLIEEEDETALRQWLVENYDVTAEQARAIAGARLPDGYGRFGLTATKDLIEALEAEVIVYSEAVQKAGLGHHSDFRTGEIWRDEDGTPALPYYGKVLERFIMPGTGNPDDPEELRIGKLTNPTVHIALNQLRRVVNRLIRTYGPPAQIAIELARELKLTEDEKRKRNRENNENRIAAEDRSRKLAEIKQRDSGANRALLKLWQELNPHNVLDRRCVYTGKQISIDMLFNGEAEIDHILPFTETLDDSNANKIVCLRDVNRLKRKRSPYEARLDLFNRFGADADWDAIAARAARLPQNKRWRFQPDAMQEFVAKGGFLARHLTDTQYLSRLAREYLSALYPHSGEGSSHVWVSPGRLTEMVRRKLGLNELLPDHNFGGGADQPKNRLDHRHHAIDAAVIAIVDRPMLQAIARASGQDGTEGIERIIVPEPWDGFRDDLRRAVNRITVSHRPDHGTISKAGAAKGKDQTAGRLHNETAYGITGEKDAKGKTIVVHRVPLTSLKKATDIEDVRDPVLRKALQDFTRGLDGKAFEEKLQTFPKLGHLSYRNIRRLRVVEPLDVIPIKDKNGRIYKGYKGDSNYRYDVWELKDGKWVAEVVSMFDAHQPGWTSPVRAKNPVARKVLSLHQSDLIAIEPSEGDRRLLRVVKFAQSGAITFAPPNEGGNLKARDSAADDPFKYVYLSAGSLKNNKARQVRVDELGRVADPGFPARKTRRLTRKPLAAE